MLRPFSAPHQRRIEGRGFVYNYLTNKKILPQSRRIRRPRAHIFDGALRMREEGREHYPLQGGKNACEEC